MTNSNRTRKAPKRGRFLQKGALALLLATMAGALTFGAAASLSLTSDDLGSGTAPIEACDADNIHIGNWQGVSPYAVTLSNVDNRCDGQAYVLTVFLDGAHTSYSGTVPVDGASTAFDVSLIVPPGVPISNLIDNVALTITGEAA